MKFKNWFTPHPDTHQKSPLLHWHYLLIYILIFILFRVGIDLVEVYKPGILGVNSNITVEEVINKTNEERQKLGLPPVAMNENLNKAAQAKAQNMFEENYWAHYSPSGKDPWGFILGSGYKFSYAGENLAKNFTDVNTVMKAWMNSPTHKENIVSSKYTEIGVAVVDGVLQGQKTTLVVQEFGRPYEALAEAPPVVNVAGQKITVEGNQSHEVLPIVNVESVKNVSPALIDPQKLIQGVGLGMVIGLGGLIALDLIILKRRNAFRISSHHLAHLSVLALSGGSLLMQQGGSVL